MSTVSSLGWGGAVGRGLMGAFVVAGLTLPAGLSAQQSEPSGSTEAQRTTESSTGPRGVFDVRPASGEIRIDGTLDEAAWANAQPVQLLYETAVGDNAAPPFATHCFVTYDAENLYFGCEAEDPEPGAIRAFLSDRDRIMSHDRISFVVDPFNDSRRAFEFQVSPLGIQADRSYNAQLNQWDLTWDAIWNSAGGRTEDGFAVEAAIPFRSLRFPDVEGSQSWGFFFVREWPRSQALSIRSFEWDRGDSCLLCQANVMRGIQGVSPGVDVQLTPTVTTLRSDAVDPGSGSDGLVTGSVDSEFGLDARWNINTGLTLNSTINPDFSQVEADVPQLEVNQRFALFFPEKRAFFLEGADLFRTPIQAFFSRSIVSPSFGSKLTGKIGSNAVGVLVASDGSSTLTIPGNQGSSIASLDQTVTTAVGRFRRDVGSSSSVGALYTGRLGDGYSNHVLAVDASLQIAGPIRANVQLLQSETDYPDELARSLDQREDRFGGTAFNTNVQYNTRNWFANVFYRNLGTHFRADAGFVNQVDVIGFGGSATRRFFGEGGGWLTSGELTFGANRNADRDGERANQSLWGFFQYVGPHQLTIWVNPFIRQDHFAGNDFDLHGTWTEISIRPGSRLNLGFMGVFGKTIDFTNAQRADERRLTTRASLRVGRGLDINASLEAQRLSKDGEDIFTAQVSQLRAVYNFSNRARLRSTFQWRSTEFNPAQNPEGITPESDRLFSELLFSYKVNPLTVLFVGYGDNRSGSLDADRIRTPFAQTDRVFFLKVGYAWRP